MISSLLLFCGSRTGHDPAQAELAAAVGTLCAERSVTLVYGGGSIGLMGVAARAALAAGGKVVGVIPEALKTAEIAQDGLTELIVVTTLHERKAIMHQRSDAILAIAGGIGTLDELFESMTWRELGIHSKPIWVMGANGFWAPFLAVIDHLSATGFAPADLHRMAVPLPGIAALAEQLPPAAGARQ